jgi:hypothetical protein
MKIEILTDEGFSTFHTISRKKSDNLYKIIFADDSDIIATGDHRFFVDNTEIMVCNINPGHILDPGKEVLSVQKIEETQYVYDVVETKNNRFVANGIVSHNCAWLGSSGTLITGSKLKELYPETPITQAEGLTQYNKPEKDHAYALIADVSRGKGLDYSAFSVIDITKMPYRQVCAFRDNFIIPVDYATVVHNVAKLYNEAHVLVEVNDIGGQVSDILYLDYGYENMVFTENAGRSGKRVSGGFGKNVDRGIRTTKSVKTVGCSVLKMLIEQNQLLIQDFHTIQELSRFSRKGSSYEAESGSHDDLVMGLVLFAWLSDQAYFRDLTDINTIASLREKTEEQIENELLPFGFINDGLNDSDFGYESESSTWL